MTSDTPDKRDEFSAAAAAENLRADRTDSVQLPAHLEMIRLLGAGSMARVYLARNRTLKRLEAIKVLRPELAADTTARQRFEREAQAAARLSHEGVTTVYSVGRLANGAPFIEMEYVDGRNLADVIRSRRSFSVDEARDLLAQIAAALAAAHEQNVVHRDVKPANVLIDNQTERACLTDFGVAAILASGSEAVTRLTRVDERFGDPRYMSPEQLRGEELTGQTDVYSLGIIGYEMLTGQGPFDDPEIGNMAGAHLRRPPPSVADRRAEVPAALADLLQRCLSKRPEHRPRAKDLAAQLAGEIATDHASGDAGPPGALQEFLGELRRRKVYRTAAAYGALVFLVLQAADLLLPALPDSELLYRYTVIVCLAGFPVAVALSWLFDWRQGRIVRADDETSPLARTATRAQRLVLKVVGLGLSIAVAVSIAIWLLPA